MVVTALVLVVLATLLIGARGVVIRSTSDFLVASRRLSPTVNAAAVSGEYLSAASFLGVAGLVVKDGIGALWYPVGFTAGLRPDARAGGGPDAADRGAHGARLCAGPAGFAGAASALRRRGDRDRRAVPGAAVQGRRAAADPGRRYPVLGGRGGRRRRGVDHAGAGRDACRHLRAGVPVPVEDGAVHGAGDL